MELSTIHGLWKCNKCGACTAVCPLYQHTVYEGMAARGKLALLEAVVEGKLIPSQALRVKLEDCLLCGACAANCPSLVPTTALFLEARAELTRLDGIPLPLRLFLYALRTPRIMGAGMPALRMLQRTGLPQLLEERGGAFVPESIRAALRRTPSVPTRPYQVRPLALPLDRMAAQRTVAHFAGCIMNWVYADAARATRLVLRSNGYRVESPSVVCCGMPHRVAGDIEAARRLARANVEALEQYSSIVTDCATCGAALREYRELLAGDPAYRVRAGAVSGKVADVSEFLMKNGLVRPEGKVRIRVTYHDPCHLVRGQGVRAQPRDLLKSIPGIEFVEMKGADVCCGGAGSFCVTHRDLSEKVGAAKVESILATGAEVVATGCPSCISQLQALLKDRGCRIKVCHPVELVAGGYSSEKAPVETICMHGHPSLL